MTFGTSSGSSLSVAGSVGEASGTHGRTGDVRWERYPLLAQQTQAKGCVRIQNSVWQRASPSGRVAVSSAA
jgi:hypothetical protein